jgi:hypothetical protein
MLKNSPKIQNQPIKINLKRNDYFLKSYEYPIRISITVGLCSPKCDNFSQSGHTGCETRRHRNLRSRTITYVGTGLANIFGERTPCKKLADFYPRQGNLLQRNNFSVVYKTSLHFTK